MSKRKPSFLWCVTVVRYIIRMLVADCGVRTSRHLIYWRTTMSIMTVAPHKLCFQLLCMVVGLAPIQASLAVTSSSVSAASTVKVKPAPAPAKPAVVVVTKAAPAKAHTPSVAPKPLAMAKPLAASAKAGAKPNLNAGSQKPAPGANAAPTSAVSLNKAVQP